MKLFARFFGTMMFPVRFAIDDNGGGGTGAAQADTTGAADGQAQTQGTTDGASQAAGGTAQTGDNQTQQTAADWTKDQRYERMWKKDPNGLFKSYTELEKVYNPLKEKHGALEKQISEITGIFKEGGIEPTPEQIKGVLAELKTLKDPENLVNKRNAFLSHWLDDESRFTRYGEKIDKFFGELSEQELLDDHPGLTRDQALRQAALEREHNDLKKQLDAIQGEKQQQAASERMNKGIEAAKAYAEKVGFPWSEETHKTLIKSCMDNGISTAHVFQEFLRINGDAIEKAYAEKIRQEQLKNLNQNKGSTVPAAGSNASSVGTAGKKTNFKESMMNILGGSKT
jgi:hypothetical protein